MPLKSFGIFFIETGIMANNLTVREANEIERERRERKFQAVFIPFSYVLMSTSNIVRRVWGLTNSGAQWEPPIFL